MTNLTKVFFSVWSTKKFCRVKFNGVLRQRLPPKIKQGLLSAHTKEVNQRRKAGTLTLDSAQQYRDFWGTGSSRDHLLKMMLHETNPHML